VKPEREKMWLSTFGKSCSSGSCSRGRFFQEVPVDGLACRLTGELAFRRVEKVPLYG
jgi:hypothetical protein